MNKYLQAFKAYDIRGIFAEEIDAYFCFIMGYGIGQDLIKNHGSDTKILLGSDTRKINKELIDAFVVWLTSAHVTHIDHIHSYANSDYPYGIISTSAAYFIGQNTWDCIAIFTASHNPAEYTGIKIFDKNGKLADTANLKNLFAEAKIQRKNQDIPNKANIYKQDPDKVTKKIQQYQEFLEKKRWNLHKNHHFVVDFSHGSAVTAEKYFYNNHAKNHLIHMINDYPDWTFPAHESETSNPENYTQLKQEIKKHKAEFWVMFDWDADRIGIVSNTGEVVPWDIIYAIILSEILKETDKNTICLYDCMSSKIVAETIKQYWATPKINKVWRFFINNEIQKVWALIGWEVSGHYMFGELEGSESVLLAQYYIMKALENYNNFDEMIQKYKKYHKWPVMSIKTDNKDKIMKRIQTYFAQEEIKNIDGISIYADTYRCNIRPSNTEPKIRFTVEANNKAIREEKITEIKKLIAE